jgi:hypothetical protein
MLSWRRVADNGNGATRDIGSRRHVHIVIIAWLYVTLLMALTLSSALAGVAFFTFLGLAPVLFYASLAVRRVRRRREERAGSMRERDVHGGDDADAKPDQ